MICHNDYDLIPDYWIVLSTSSQELELFSSLKITFVRTLSTAGEKSQNNYKQ
jgi:hypothetical protein